MSRAVLFRAAGLSTVAAGIALAWSAGAPVNSVTQMSRSHISAPSVAAALILPPAESGPATSAPPIRLEIPSVSIDAVVQPVGVGVDGNMGVPPNTDQVGWLSSGTRPGRRGNAVMDGHLDDRFGRPAVFWALSRLQAGDRIIVRTEERDLVFTVTTVQSYEVAHFPRLAVFGPALQPQLNLITCAGAWDRGRRAYTRREVIFARLLPTTRSPHRWQPL